MTVREDSCQTEEQLGREARDVAVMRTHGQAASRQARIQTGGQRGKRTDRLGVRKHTERHTHTN